MPDIDQATYIRILQALVENSQESIFVTDGDGNVILLNEIAARLIGVPISELLGKNVVELEENEILNPSVVRVVLRDRVQVSRVIRTPAEKKLLAQCTPIFDETGKIILTITNSNNESNLKHLMSRLDEEREKTTRYQQELAYLRRSEDAEVVVSTGPAMQRVMQQIAIVAPTESTVVLYGQSGTGKDVIAKTIHRKSSRADRALLSVNCAAIPETLIESELFGYEKGSFTGAGSQGKQGIFEVADGGTLFLDEIGELPLSAQAKLLRVFENGEIRRVGGTKTITVDVRIICATNRDLWKMVEEQKFREDLYYRINIFPIYLEPLCQRKEDILPLAQDFLLRLNRKYNTHKVISPAFAEQLMAHSWPGNIRELRNIIERAYLVSSGRELMLDIPLAVKAGTPSAAQARPPQDVIPLKAYLGQVERQYIQRVIQENGGSVAQAAEKLQVHRSVLYRKLQQKPDMS